MIFYFKNKTELEIVVNFDEKTEKAETEKETFDAYEKIEGEIVNEVENYVDIQFPDGSVAYSVLREDFEIEA